MILDCGNHYIFNELNLLQDMHVKPRILELYFIFDTTGTVGVHDEIMSKISIEVLTHVEKIFIFYT